MNKIISCSGKLNEIRNEFFKSLYVNYKNSLTVIPYSRVNLEMQRWNKLLYYYSNGS